MASGIKVKAAISSDEKRIKKPKPKNDLILVKKDQNPKQLTFTSQEANNSQQMSQTSNVSM